MNLGKQIRLNRIFSHPSGKLCSIAIDHFVGYGSGLPRGLSNLPHTLAEVIKAMPDAVTMTKGTALSCWGPHAGKVPLILQAGCFTVDERIIEMITDPAECIRMGADAIAVSIGVRGNTEGKFIQALSTKVTEATKYDLPVIAHIYPRVYEPTGIRIVHDPENIRWAVRVGIECGADVIKVGYTGDVKSFSQIISECPVPIVAAGGPKCETLKDALKMMSESVQAGGRGATIGRNAWGQADIPAAIRAFKAVIHDGKSPAEVV
jgi:fructose-bisphosphate aldolase, class I